jgi:hypothetical protein
VVTAELDEDAPHTDPTALGMDDDDSEIPELEVDDDVPMLETDDADALVPMSRNVDVDALRTEATPPTEDLDADDLADTAPDLEITTPVIGEPDALFEDDPVDLGAEDVALELGDEEIVALTADLDTNDLDLVVSGPDDGNDSLFESPGVELTDSEEETRD